MKTPVVAVAAALAAGTWNPLVHAENARASAAPPGGANFVQAKFAPPNTLPAAPARAPFSSDDTIVFSAPPRESEPEGEAIYRPIADYLSRATGKRIVYRYPGTWGVYRSEMLRGAYDLVFDGPHFNAYRAERLQHNVLVKVPSRHAFVVITRQTQPFAGVQQMAGRTFCTHAPPNLATLVLLEQFDNPARQPMIVNTEGWQNIYAGVSAGRCVGAILPLAIYKQFDRGGEMKVVYQSASMPNQAFSAGPRVSEADQRQIAAALVAPEAAAATAKLRAAFKVGEHFAPASNAEYVGLASYLRNEWGYQ
jgi:ABC-type phosphate/phosphonate transport system substrate-binding protein